MNIYSQSITKMALLGLGLDKKVQLCCSSTGSRCSAMVVVKWQEGFAEPAVS